MNENDSKKVVVVSRKHFFFFFLVFLTLFFAREKESALFSLSLSLLINKGVFVSKRTTIDDQKTTRTLSREKRPLFPVDDIVWWWWFRGARYKRSVLILQRGGYSY